MSFSALAQLRQRLRRRRRRIAWTLLALAAGLACAWGVLVEGTLLRHVVAWSIGSRLGTECTIDEFHWNGWNRATIRGLSLHVEGWPASASEVIAIGEMDANFDPLPLLWGSLALTDIRVDRMTIRAIERNDGQELNLLAMHLPETRGTVRPPRISIQGLSMQLGVLDDRTGEVRIEAERSLVGSLFSDREVRDKWHVELTQRTPVMRDPPKLSGWLVGDSFEYEVSLSNLPLDDALRRLFPGPIKHVWTQMQLTGSIDQINMSGDRDHPVRSAHVLVSDIDLTLPDAGVKDVWARYANGDIMDESGLPRIQVHKGVVRFDDWRLKLEHLEGTLGSSDADADVVSMPVELSFWIDLDQGRLWNWNGTNPEQWAESALEHAPFGLHLVVQKYGIRSAEGRAPALELPRAAAEILENFTVTEGVVSIDAHVERGPPFWRHREEPGAEPPDEGPIASEVQFHGSIAIDDGTGGYFKFPYSMHDVQASIAFANDVVDVEYLRGRGSKECEITIAGTVFDPGDDAGVDLRISSRRAPIDEALESALQHSPTRKFLTLLFNRPAFAALEASGLPARVVEGMRADRERLLAEAASLRAADGASAANDERRAEISAEMRRLQSLDWLADFRPGGWCELALRIQREVAGGERVVTTGSITLLEGNAFCEPLPYPLHVLGRDAVGASASTITIEDERILLPEGGLRLQLPGGGTGTVAGTIELPRTGPDERTVTPRISIDTRGDAINPLLLAAIPLDDPSEPGHSAGRGWPGTRRSPAADMIDAIGLSGVLGSAIEIGGDGAGDVNWRVLLDLRDGRATPRSDVAEELSESGLEWPEGLDLERCTASAFVDEQRAKLVSFEGWHDGTGHLVAEGDVDLSTGARTLRAGFHEMSLGRYLVNLLPQHDREQGRKFWNDHAPDGRFDAQLEWSRDVEGVHRRRLEVIPDWVSFRTLAPDHEPSASGARVRVVRDAGDLLVVDRNASARGLRLSIEEPGAARSTLVVDGGYSPAPSGEAPALGASWTNARFESPLLLEGLHLAGADDAVALWTETRPRGEFDALLTFLAGVRDRESQWRIRLRADELTADLGETSTTIRVEPDSSPVTIEPGVVTLDHFAARTDNGRFDLDGQIPLDPEHAEDRRLHVRYDGARAGAPEYALAGPRAVRALESIDFLCDGPVSIREGVVEFVTEDGELSSRFAGDVDLVNASFHSGVIFDRVDARLHVRIDPTDRSRFDVVAPSFRVDGHPVRNGRATLFIAADGSTVDVPRFDGEIAGGSGSAGIKVRIDPALAGGGSYEVWARLVGGQLAELAGDAEVDAVSGAGSKGLATGSTGRVDAELLVGGRLDDKRGRVGRGRIEIRDGRMAELPITLSLLQVTQLMLPLNTALDSGDIRFHVAGERVVFDRFELRSPTLEFKGKGELDLRTDELALRFQNKGTVPLWSDFFGLVSNTLYAIDVTGTLDKPVVSVAPLPVFGGGPVAAREAQP